MFIDAPAIAVMMWAVWDGVFDDIGLIWLVPVTLGLVAICHAVAHVARALLEGRRNG
jgi:RsiW-degrading membrane proteinase PrsW (M82 family)